MRAVSVKVAPSSVERYTWSALLGPSTWLTAVRCTSQIAPFHVTRSVFSLWRQIRVRQSIDVSSGPATSRLVSESHAGVAPGVSGPFVASSSGAASAPPGGGVAEDDEQPAMATARPRATRTQRTVDS